MFQHYVLDILSGIYARLGAKETVNDRHTEKLNRVLVLKWLCKFGHKECRAEANSSIQAWKKSKHIVPPNLQEPFFCGAMINATEKDWNFLYSQYEKSIDTDLKIRILYGLGCSENTTILRR